LPTLVVIVLLILVVVAREGEVFSWLIYIFFMTSDVMHLSLSLSLSLSLFLSLWREGTGV
jgi:hypothetical protein